MEAEKEMNENSNEQAAVREYLLGTLRDAVEIRRLEEKLLLDDDFEEQLFIAEDELMHEYLSDALNETEREHFLQFFLISPERNERLRLIGNLKKYAASRAGVEEVKKSSPKKTDWLDWRGLSASPAWRFAAVALLVVGVGFSIWLMQRQIARPESDIDKGLAQLRLAYRGQRPTESRTTADFDYAPVSQTRGKTPEPAAEKIRARARAERLLLDASENASDAAAHHALGLFYLAEKKFDEALTEFNRALELAPDNAKLHNDVGALYLEKANLAARDEKLPEVPENLNASLRHLERALELNGNLSEALFNRALVLQKMPLANQAREAWEKYLEKDSTSPWADEARRQLQQLESQKSPNLSADQLEQAFLVAFNRKNETEAGRLISQNRELIKGKYLPQKLAGSLVAASGGEKNERLQALIYAGDLEEKNIGDSFAKDLAAFYAKISDADSERLKQAQASMQNSYRRLLNGDKKSEVAAEAARARQLFLQAGDVYEAKLSEFLIVYCLIKTEGQMKNSLSLAGEIVNFSRRSNYKWLLANTLFWLAEAQRGTGDRAQAKVNYKHCLTLAKEIKDSQVLQKIFVTLARQNIFFGQNRLALDYLQQALNDAGEAQWLSPRERWRTYSEGVEIMASVRLYSLAKAISLENIQLARDLKAAEFIVYSQLDAGIVHAQAEDFNEARTWLNEARQNAETSLEGTDRKECLAKSLLTLGYLERKLKNYSQAEIFYDEALSVVENAEFPFFLYEIRKGRLLTDISLNKQAEIEEQIAKTIDLAENYRKQIRSEREQISFFNNQQDIYDIAVANEFKQARYERAYNYLETSNSRSLLEWISKGVNIEENGKEIEINFNEQTVPLRLDKIRAQMPARVQILQYAVLENKVLIWLVSKDKFTVVASEIEAEKLSEKVEAYIQMVSVRNNQKPEEEKVLARELYDWLIAPVVNQLDPAREICLIPQKILFHLPFNALTAPDGKRFLAQFNFFYAPSANVFLLSTEKARQKSALTDESLLSIGNPRFDRNEFKDFQYLPEAEDEAREIMQYYPHSQKLIGAEAVKTAVQNSLQNAEVVNFAGHYIVKPGEPLASGLLLTKTGDGENSGDGVLTNAELISQKLPQIKLVVLSACQTGVERYYNGEGLVGLSTTFLKAGAPMVVASQWQVDSGAAAELMKKFHFLRKQEKLSTTAALRRAQLEMMETPDGSYRQPYFWAAFAAYGGYAEF
jgi:CHAT domain-containing protein/tetratricopeptide (TPR) repeat protein